MMKRSQFLKAAGSAFALPWVWSGAAHAQGVAKPRGNCVLVPSEIAGPFPLDLNENDFFFRQDITEDRPGVRLRQRVRILGDQNCAPMANVRVNVWHCDRDGGYSGYGTEEGLTYCRGYQFTDDNGECEFVTIVPGWYPGRVTHMHFQVYVSSQYSAVSQWTWPHEAVVGATNAHPALYPAGPDPLAPEQDGAFVDGFEWQLASLEWDEAAGEYVSFYECTVQGEGTSGVGLQERLNAEVMTLGDCHPNPATDRADLPLTLRCPAEVAWSIWNLQGQKVQAQSLGQYGPGDHRLTLERKDAAWPAGPCMVLVELNIEGRRFTDVRRLMVQR